MLDYVAFTQRRQQRAEVVGLLRATCPAACSTCPAARSASPSASSIATSRASSTPIRSSPRASAPTFRRSRPSGGYDVNEAYAELRLPLLRDTAFFHRLELTGAARYSDYSTSGSTTTFKAGINWKPIEDLLFRGTWAEGFRAPSIGELFGTPSRFDQELVDPCSGRPARLPGQRSRANCIADGVPANGSYAQLNAQLPVITGGNEDLDPETSKSWGVGAVWRPSFLPRLSLEANYYNIKVDGAIQAIDADDLLGRCVDDTAIELSCAAIDPHAPRGQVTQIRGLLQNIAGIETDGLDLTCQLSQPAHDRAGTFGLTWNNTFLFNYHGHRPGHERRHRDRPRRHRAGQPRPGLPEIQVDRIIDWTLDDFGASLTGRYIEGVEEGDGNELDSRFYTDVQLRW